MNDSAKNTAAEYEHIPADMFEFQQMNARIHDTKLQTKSRGYFKDAFLRFKKNKSSVVAAIIIGCLVLFAIFSPIITKTALNHTINSKDNTYVNFAPYVESIAKLNIGILDGHRTQNSANQLTIDMYNAIGQETGMNPIIGEPKSYTQREKIRGQSVDVTYYSLKINSYYYIGVVDRNIDYETFDKIQQFQNETGIQVLYPVVDQVDCYVHEYSEMDAEAASRLTVNSNLWYKVKDAKGNPVRDASGNLIPAYCSNAAKQGPVTYNSLRIEGDDGSYIYSMAKSGSLNVRVCYYNYYQFLQWNTNADKSYHAPCYLMGTNNMGQDLFCAIGVGARFSLVFALLVSAINLTIGAIYGAIQGYYGGAIDLTLDRISDILSGVPFIVVATLFQLHLAEKVGSVPSFLFAFVLTGWIGMAALTRKQFYRFKSQEHILAARTLGAGDWRLMFKHIFPNALGTIVTSCALVIPGVIGSETNLTYLGIINLSEFAGTSLGVLMQQGQIAMTASPHAMFFPSMFFALLMISFNLFGNGLRDAFNPTMRGAEG